MPAFNKNANGGSSVPLNLAPRGKRSGSGQVDTLWRGSLPAVVATGGTVTDIVVNGVPYKLHTFTSSQTFTVISGGNVEYMMVGGGSSTGSTQNGGGAGQVTNGIVAAPVGSNSIGVGGAASPSTALGITATSGSGSTSGNGYVTGANYSGTFQNVCLGGGGGATANGGNASNSAGGSGGAGRDISTWLGQSAGTTYKGGGGGGAGYGNIDWGNPTPGTSPGGIGGGGSGGNSGNCNNGEANSGGGAGSGGGLQGYPFDTGQGRTGGSGIVYIRYPRDFGL
jgi:hypothetical protein